MKKILITIALLTSFVGVSQSIYKSSIDAGGNSTASDNIQVLYTIGEVNVQELSAGNIQASEGFVGPAFKIMIEPKLYLQGPILNPLVAGQMNDNLRSGGHLPTSSPYIDGATCNAAVFNTTGANAIVDWVWIELRASNDNTKLVNGRSALLQRDGDVVALDGLVNLTMTAAPTNYYVVVNHRNHLGAMSANSIGLSESVSAIVDFRNNGFQTYGSNAQVTLGTGDTALWAGDTNESDQTKFSGASNSANIIKDYILSDPSNILNFITFGSTGYLNIDVDMNGIGKFSGASNDSNIIKDNVLAHPGNILNFITFTINSTVPN